MIDKSKNTSLARRLRRSQNEIEIEMWFFLRSRRFVGYKFRRQFPIDNYVVDFCCLERRLIVELDGGGHNKPDQIKKDKKREDYLKDHNFRIIRIWNNEFNINQEGALQRILESLEEPLIHPVRRGTFSSKGRRESQIHKKINLAVFASTKGTDLQGIIDAKKIGDLDFVNLKFVLSDRKDSGVLEKARIAGIEDIFLDAKGKSREEYDQECLKICRKYAVDLILLIGYMRIIGSTLIEPYKNRIINIHPSLLPKYPGMDLDVHQSVLDAGEKETGCTLHFVDEGVDTGRIILQKEVAILHGDTPKSLKKRVQEKEQEVILEGLKKISDSRL